MTASPLPSFELLTNTWNSEPLIVFRGVVAGKRRCFVSDDVESIWRLIAKASGEDASIGVRPAVHSATVYTVMGESPPVSAP